MPARDAQRSQALLATRPQRAGVIAHSWRVVGTVEADRRVETERVCGLGRDPEDLGTEAGPGFLVGLKAEDHRTNGSDRVVDVAHGLMDALLGLGGWSTAPSFPARAPRRKAAGSPSRADRGRCVRDRTRPGVARPRGAPAPARMPGRLACRTTASGRSRGPEGSRPEARSTPMTANVSSPAVRGTKIAAPAPASTRRVRHATRRRSVTNSPATARDGCDQRTTVGTDPASAAAPSPWACATEDHRRRFATHAATTVASTMARTARRRASLARPRVVVRARRGSIRSTPRGALASDGFRCGRVSPSRAAERAVFVPQRRQRRLGPETLAVTAHAPSCILRTAVRGCRSRSRAGRPDATSSGR